MYYVHVYIYIYIYIYTHISLSLYIYIYIHINVYTHIRIPCYARPVSRLFRALRDLVHLLLGRLFAIQH